MSFCGSCGGPISDTANFCGGCGADQRTFATEATPTSAEPPTSQLPAGVDVDPETTLVSDRHREQRPSADPPPPQSGAEPAPTEQRPEPHAEGELADRPQAPSTAEVPPPVEPRPAVPPRGEGPPPHGPPGIDALGPGAGEFASQLASQAQAPGVQAALISGGIASAVCFGVGLLLAVAFSDETILGVIGGLDLEDGEPGMVSEALAQTVGLLLVKLGGLGAIDGEGSATLRFTPLTLVFVPIAACAIAAASQAYRTAGASARVRVLWGAVTGVPFAVAMLVFAIAAGDLDPQVGAAFALGALWGAVGGAAGVAWKVRREQPHQLATVLPRAARGPLAILTAAARPLIVAVALGAVVGTSVWCVQAIRGESSARLSTSGDEGSLPAALAQSILYAADHGVNYTALGSGSSFKLEALPPIPLDDDATGSPLAEGSSEYRLFDFNDGVAPALFVPLLIALMLLPIALALFAGFSVARATRARTPQLGAAWGLLVGPVWATVLALLNAMSPHIVGRPVGDSLFGITLLAGAALGALGGLLATQTRSPAQRG